MSVVLQFRPTLAAMAFGALVKTAWRRYRLKVILHRHEVGGLIRHGVRRRGGLKLKHHRHEVGGLGQRR